MSPDPKHIMPQFDPPFLLLLATVWVAGLVRGFAGFGTGMIIAPVAAALYGPQMAVVVIFVVDTFPAIPVTIPALRQARWREVLPVAFGAALLVPLGVFILKNGDPTLLRWFICALILASVAVLTSGWRYHGPRTMPVSIGVGGLSGFLGGVAAIPGPPPILYWMASPLPAMMVRANMLVLLLISELASGINLWAADLFTETALWHGVFAAPAYFIGILVGWRMFGLASEATYRRIAFTIILLASLGAMPVFDGMTLMDPDPSGG